METHDDDGEGAASNGDNGRRERQRRRLANVTGKKTPLSGRARAAAIVVGDADSFGGWTPPPPPPHYQSRALSIPTTSASATATTGTNQGGIVLARAAEDEPGEKAHIDGSSSGTIHLKQQPHNDAGVAFNQSAHATTGRRGERLLDEGEEVEEPAAGEGGLEAKEMADGGGAAVAAAAAALPLDFIPNVAFENATSVRFVFTARLDLAPPSSNGNGEGEGDAWDFDTITCSCQADYFS